MFVREHIEAKIVNRLCKRKKTDKKVPDAYFNQINNNLDKKIKEISHNTKLEGFTPEDIDSILRLKLHQMLRRGHWDEKRGYSYCVKSFKTLLWDMKRMSDSARARGLDDDLLDKCSALWHENVFNSEEN